MGLLNAEYKIEFYKNDDKLLTLGANKPKKVSKMVDTGISTKPCNSVVIYKYEGLLKRGYVIQFNGSPEDALQFANNLK